MKTIAKYEICGLLGRGGMSRVYKVRFPLIGKIAALKLLDPHPHLIDLMGETIIRDLFVAEAMTIAGLKHPNIVEIWDFDEADGRPFYLMDYCCNNLGLMIGETFRTEKPSRMIPPAKVFDYIRQTLEGLACLHHAGIVHRDIKPYNLLITEQDTIKICDFGLSKPRGETFQGPPNLKIGSPWYAPPEQELDPERVDCSADIYATGVVFYRMLTGLLPDAPRRPLSQLNPILDKAWDRFAEQALAPDPGDRFADARAMLAALEDLQRCWQSSQERICRLVTPPGVEAAADASPPEVLRRQPIKVDPRRAPRIFATDALWRPLRYRHRTLMTAPDGTIADRSAGLVWQKSGSPYPMTWVQARGYIHRLNAQDSPRGLVWRLPTVNELLSLLSEPLGDEALCIAPLFDQRQKWLWSCDRRSYTAAWYVSVDLGYASWQDLTCLFYVRAVRGL